MTVDLKKLFEDLNTGNGITERRALAKLEGIKDCKVISFSQFSTICKYKHNVYYCLCNIRQSDVVLAGRAEKCGLLSVCNKDSCPRYNLL